MTDRTWEGEPLKISNSEIQLFKDDRRQWYLAYYRRLRYKKLFDDVAGAKELGTRVHTILESAYSSDISPLLTLKDVYESDIAKYTEAGVPSELITSLEKEHALAHAMVSGFVDWIEENGVDDGIEVVAVEDVIEVKSHIEGVYWKGKMDQRVVRESDGARLFRDWKTVADMKTPALMLPHDEQMKFYHLLEYLDARAKTGGEPQWRTDGALYFMLKKVKRTSTAKPPFYGQLEVHHNIHEIRNMYKRVAKVTEEIVDTRRALDAGGDHQYLCPPRPNRDWTWKNDFFPVMTLMDDGSDFEGMLSEYYETHDPDERYAKS